MTALVPDFKPTLLDRIVSWYDPVRGAERMQARYQMSIAQKWIGARLDRNASRNWWTTVGSADRDSIFDLQSLRNRSRDTQRNNPLALGAINTAVTSSVGTGLVMRSRIDYETLGLTPEEAQAIQKQIEREFRTWCEHPLSCDISGQLDFYQIQELAFRSAFESGDVFALLRQTPNRRNQLYKTKVQLIEADRVSNQNFQLNTKNLVSGIEKDDDGMPIKYHIMRQHPGGLYAVGRWEWDIVDAFGSRTGRRNVVHLFDPKRVDQTRGIPYLAPVIELLHQLGDYTQAEVTAAVVSGMFTVFVKSETGQGLETGYPIPGAAGESSTQQSGSNISMGNGAIVDLAPGEGVEFADPKRPNVAFDPFVQAVLRQIGVALELPFEVLIKHFTASYSAARAAMLEAWKFFKKRRAWLATMFCQPIFEAWMEEAVSSGRINATGFFSSPAVRRAWLNCVWIGDAPGQLDPLKEVEAAGKRLDLLLTTRSEEKAALDGGEWSDTITERAYEQTLINKSGIPVIVAKGQMEEVSGKPEAPEPNPDNGDLESN